MVMSALDGAICVLPGRVAQSHHSVILKKTRIARACRVSLNVRLMFFTRTACSPPVYFLVATRTVSVLLKTWGQTSQ